MGYWLFQGRNNFTHCRGILGLLSNEFLLGRKLFPHNCFSALLLLGVFAVDALCNIYLPPSGQDRNEY